MKSASKKKVFIEKLKSKVSKNSLLEAHQHLLPIDEDRIDSKLSSKLSSKLGGMKSPTSSRANSSLMFQKEELPESDIDMLYIKMCED